MNHDLSETLRNVKENYAMAMEEIRLNEALEEIWKLIHAGDRYINEEKPWKKTLQQVQGGEKLEVIFDLLLLILEIAFLLEPFLPETVKKIKEQINIKGGTFEIKKGTNLFPRR